jgi:hypothetical protein
MLGMLPHRINKAARQSPLQPTGLATFSGHVNVFDQQVLFYEGFLLFVITYACVILKIVYLYELLLCLCILLHTFLRGISYVLRK